MLEDIEDLEAPFVARYVGSGARGPVHVRKVAYNPKSRRPVFFVTSIEWACSPRGHKKFWTPGVLLHLEGHTSIIHNPKLLASMGWQYTREGSQWRRLHPIERLALEAPGEVTHG